MLTHKLQVALLEGILVAANDDAGLVAPEVEDPFLGVGVAEEPGHGFNIGIGKSI